MNTKSINDINISGAREQVCTTNPKVMVNGILFLLIQGIYKLYLCILSVLQQTVQQHLLYNIM